MGPATLRVCRYSGARPAGNRVILVDAGKLAVTDLGLEVSASEQAALQMSTTPTAGAANVVPACQTDTSFVRIIRYVHWTLATDNAVAFNEISELEQDRRRNAQRTPGRRQRDRGTIARDVRCARHATRFARATCRGAGGSTRQAKTLTYDGVWDASKTYGVGRRSDRSDTHAAPRSQREGAVDAAARDLPDRHPGR